MNKEKKESRTKYEGMKPLVNGVKKIKPKLSSHMKYLNKKMNGCTNSYSIILEAFNSASISFQKSDLKKQRSIC